MYSKKGLRVESYEKVGTGTLYGKIQYITGPITLVTFKKNKTTTINHAKFSSRIKVAEL
jgi:hypothetical protein